MNSDELMQFECLSLSPPPQTQSLEHIRLPGPGTQDPGPITQYPGPGSGKMGPVTRDLGPMKQGT